MESSAIDRVDMRRRRRSLESFSRLTTGFDFHYWYDDWSKQHLNLERSVKRHG